MAKMTRERMVKEKRALKKERREERRLAALAEANGETVDETVPAQDEDETSSDAAA